MHPVLIKLGDFPVHTYGFMIALGFLLCVYVSKREAERQGMSGDRIVDISFWALLIGMLGCRILYIITRWDYYLVHPIEMFFIWEGGLVFWAGPLVCIPFFVWYTRKYDLDMWKTLDIGAQAVPLAHAFGRIGCFAAGCCYGRPTYSDYGVKFFTDLVDPAYQGINLHPTQIYESLSLFALFFVLRRMRFTKKFDGQIAFAYLIGYSIIRSIVEVFRGDSIRGFVIPGILSTSQFISVLVVITTLIFYFKRKHQLCRPQTA
jgi:phosphatidylglycerol:prolipoprotein diacylglycerol transferase